MVSDVSLHPYTTTWTAAERTLRGEAGAASQTLRVRATFKVRRCKLDPNLKAPGFKGST